MEAQLAVALSRHSEQGYLKRQSNTNGKQEPVQWSLEQHYNDCRFEGTTNVFPVNL